ncbi:MAG: hypothetical protein J7K68_02400 [Candidatus Diapherotrites archaeon]|nr:hypothetical protein [Candidatus Diapherotrites archaeon]
MALIKSIDMRPDGIFLEVKVSKSEYRYLALHNKHVVVLPMGKEMFNEELTVGKLGNSNRVMLPKRFLKKNDIKTLPKKAPATIVSIGNNKYLIVGLVSEQKGIPIFEEG